MKWFAPQLSSPLLPFQQHCQLMCLDVSMRKKTKKKKKKLFDREL